MKTFIAKNKQEKWVKMHFGSKSKLSQKTGLTRPTIDKICKDKKSFYKHLATLSKVSGVGVGEIIESIK